MDYDETGKSIELRVGRHLTTTLGILDEWNFNFPEAEIIFECPGYYEMLENGVGAYLRNPDAVDPSRVVYD